MKSSQNLRPVSNNKLQDFTDKLYISIRYLACLRESVEHAVYRWNDNFGKQNASFNETKATLEHAVYY
jgi:hypothetical protein